MCKLYLFIANIRAFALFIIAMSLIFVSYEGASAQELLMKQDEYHSEIFLRIAPENLVSADLSGTDSIVVQFRRQIRTPFSQNLTDPYISSITGGGNRLTVTFKPTADFGAFKEADGIRFVATAMAEDANLLLSYGVASPMLRKINPGQEIPEYDMMIANADNLAKQGNYAQAIEQINSLLETTNNPYYQQEGLFKQDDIYMNAMDHARELARNENYPAAIELLDFIVGSTTDPVIEQDALFLLGDSYLKTADYDPNGYANASSTMYALVSKYPDSKRAEEALTIIGDAGDLGGSLASSADAYNKLYEISNDENVQRDALEKAADTYAQMGRYGRAIELYEEYLRAFETDTGKVRARLGNLYLIRNDKERGYRLLDGADIASIADALDIKQLLSLGKMYEERGLTDRAKGLYREIAERSGGIVTNDENTPVVTEALYRYAKLSMQDVDFKNYDWAIERLTQYGGATEYSLMGLLEYGESLLPFDDNTADDIARNVSPVYNQEDYPALKREAHELLIKAYARDKNTGQLLALIDKYFQDYPIDSKHEEMSKLKEETLFAAANSATDAGDYNSALRLYLELLRSFPDSPRNSTIIKSIEEIIKEGGSSDEAIQVYFNLLTENPDSPTVSTILSSVDSLLMNGHNYDTAISLYTELLDIFAGSEYLPRIQQYLDDAKFLKVKNLSENRRVAEARKAIEERLVAQPPVDKRWYDLYEEVLYQEIVSKIGLTSDENIRYMARDFLSTNPNGVYVDRVKSLLVDSFNEEYSAAAKEGRNADIITLYENNASWLADWPDQALANSAKVTAVNAMLALGATDSAKKLFETINPMISPDYASAGYALCEKFIYNINNMAADAFLAAVDKAEYCGADYAIALAKGYSANPAASAEAQYRIAKNIPDDNKRISILEGLARMMDAPAAQFSGYEEIFRDLGVYNYNMNNFTGALLPLKRYVDSGAAAGESKAEALYYLGKTMTQMGEAEQGAAYYQQVVAEMPTSVFSSMAKSELEDAQWRQNVQNR